MNNMILTGPINIGNPHEIPVRDLAERVVRLTGSRSRIVHKPLPEDDPTQRCPDITLAKPVLWCAPTVEPGTGLGRTVEFFREMLAGAEQLLSVNMMELEPRPPAY